MSVLQINPADSVAIPTEELYFSPTIKYLCDTRDSNYNRAEISVRDQAYAEALAAHPDGLTAVRYAYGFANFLEKKRILVNEYDILAGFAYRYTYKTTLPCIMEEDFDPKYRPYMNIDGKRERADVLRCHGLTEDSVTAQEFTFFENGVDAWLYKHWESGHILPGYERVIQIGFTGLVDIARKSMKKLTGTAREYTRAMLITSEAAVKYIRRYAEKSAAMAAAAQDPDERARLTRMAEACAQLSIGPARNFYEAVQALWFAHELNLAENMAVSESLGRLDEYLYPYYKQDLEAGALTYNEASEIIDALWIKFSANLHAYQAVTLGGTDAEGRPFETDLTYICMQATRKLLFDQPLICFRYHDEISPQLWNEVIELVKTGTGFPGIFYDPACIKARVRAGIAPEDAYKYAIVGCVEMGIPGHEYTPTEFARLNWPKLFELMFNNGQDQISDYIFPLFEPKDLNSIQTFEEFYNWYKAEMVQFISLAIRCVSKIDTMLPQYYPTPYLSSLMIGCMENGKDVTGGGTKYNNTGISTCGLATTADSLAAIKEVVFDKKIMTLSEFGRAVTANFAGYEELYHYVANKCPKFGNDIDEVDFMLKDLLQTFSQTVESHSPNPRGGNYMTGIYSVEDHAKCGAFTAATPDGRLAKLAESNSIAGVQGKDVSGPTALINSVVKCPLEIATNGMVLDLKFNPVFFNNQRHIEALHSLVKSYFQQGGLEIQFSVVSRDTLIAAQNDPVKYKDLVVRVSGFSAYFNSLMKTTQDEIIARTEYIAI